METYHEPAKELPVREVDVVVTGGGTAGVVAALAAARNGAKTLLIESKGYVGGIAVEGGTALHSFYNLWRPFPGVEKRQLVKGIPQEIVDRLSAAGGCSGHAPMSIGFNYDDICTAIDTEIYKKVAFDLLTEAGVILYVNTLLVGAIVETGSIRGVIVESRSGREAVFAHAFVDSTGYGDLAAFAGADYIELNDHPVANSIGVGGVSIEKYHAFLQSCGAVSQRAEGWRDGVEGQIVRLDAYFNHLPQALREEAHKIDMSFVTTSVHDDYFMFIKINHKMNVSPTDRDAVASAEVELRRRQARAIELLRQYVPGCEKAFITRTSPSLCIRRGRTITCDYDVSIEDIIEGRHFADDVYSYGFHDAAPRIQIKQGRSFGFPYRALLPQKIENLFCAGMMVTRSWEAHMSTRNTVSVMAMGQAAGTAAALCAIQNCNARNLPYSILLQALENDGVIFSDY